MRRGWPTLAAWAVALAVLALLPFVLGWSSLPDPVASHWGLDGAPDGAMPRSLVWLLPIAVVTLGAVLAVLFRADGRPSAESAAILGVMGGIAIWIGLSTVILNRGAATWQEAGSFGLVQVLGVVGSSILFGWAGLILGRRWFPPAESAPVSSSPALVLSESERATWTGSTSARWPLFVLGPFAVVFLFLPGWLKALAPLYLGLAFLLARVEVKVDKAGLSVRLGGALTARRIGLDRISSARAIDLEPKEWGGWGYRMIPGGTAVVLRRGDGIEVSLEGGRKFAVTVDDAATGAALLNGLVRRGA